MKLRTKDAGLSPDCDMTPMIDMTFQLIAFFMLMLNLSASEVNAKVKLPYSELAKPPKTPVEQIITVHLTDTGNAVVAGEEMPIGSLSTAIRAYQAGIEADGKTASDTTVVIRGHKNVKTGIVQETVQSCQKERLTKFVLRAASEQR